LFELKYFLAVWPIILHLLHLKGGGPLAPEGDLSFMEMTALSSSN
jgi:hypothetical protein